MSWLSCFPSNPMIEAVAKEGIRPMAFRHERGAVMAADGFSRVSDGKQFGVVAMQSQAGAENSAGGMAQANADNIPILVGWWQSIEHAIRQAQLFRGQFLGERLQTCGVHYWPQGDRQRHAACHASTEVVSARPCGCRIATRGRWAGYSRRCAELSIAASCAWRAVGWRCCRCRKSAGRCK